MSQLQRFCFAPDLKGDPALISDYERWHRHSWPEIKMSILDSGIVNGNYRSGNRLFMIMETDATFWFDRKAKMDGNGKVKEWKQVMY